MYDLKCRQLLRRALSSFPVMWNGKHLYMWLYSGSGGFFSLLHHRKTLNGWGWQEPVVQPSTNAVFQDHVKTDGGSTTSLGNLCTCSAVLTVKECFLIFRWNFLCFCFNPLPLVLSLSTTSELGFIVSAYCLVVFRHVNKIITQIPIPHYFSFSVRILWDTALKAFPNFR